MQDDWIAMAVLTGLERFASLRMNYHPPPELAQTNADEWIKAITRNLGNAIEQVDYPRIKKGFDILCATHRDWPKPIDLIESMPPRPIRRELPEPPISDEQREAGIRQIRNLSKILERATAMPTNDHRGRAALDQIERGETDG